MDQADEPNTPPDPSAVAADWIVIWQSELSAMITDRAFRDDVLRYVALIVQAANHMAHLLSQSRHDDAGRCAGSAQATRAASPMASFDDRDAANLMLGERLAKLEQQVAALAAAGQRGVPNT